MSAQKAVEITKDNDLTILVGSIRGRDPADGVVKDYPGSTVSGWIAAAENSDTALGASKSFTTVGAAKFVPFFEASEINAALTAAGALVAGQTLWLVLKATNDFRLAIPLVYRLARIA